MDNEQPSSEPPSVDELFLALENGTDLEEFSFDMLTTDQLEKLTKAVIEIQTRGEEFEFWDRVILTMGRILHDRNAHEMATKLISGGETASDLERSDFSPPDLKLDASAVGTYDDFMRTLSD